MNPKTLNLLLLISISALTIINGQEPTIKYYKIIHEDSVMLFITKDFRFTDKPCASFIRYTKVDTLGYFNGDFKDVTLNGTVLGTGSYINGVKNGYFRIYYSDGKIKCKGRYVNDLPLGRWDFFYENEKPERILMCTEKDTLMVQFCDKNGKIQVQNGVGDFSGYVNGINNLSFHVDNSERIIAKGPIINGKPDGKWSSTYLNQITYCREQFNQGKLIKRTFPSSRFPTKKQTTSKSFLNTFFLDNYLTMLERSYFEKCADSIKASQTTTTTVKYSFDMNKFSSDLLPRLEQIINNDIRNGLVDKYPFGENYMTIQFSINAEGKPENFKTLTSFGTQLVYTIENVIRKNVTFPPMVNTMYFHLKVDFPSNFVYRLNFHFSARPNF